MKKIFLIVLCLLIVAGFLAWTYAGAQNARGTPGADRDEMITVLNPAVASKMANRLPLAPRLDTLNGKTIYMIDINWGGPEAALNIFEEMQAWFAKNMPDVKTVIRMKKGGYEMDDPELWKEIGEGKGDAGILGVSG
jgi:hypothetical protein